MAEARVPLWLAVRRVDGPWTTKVADAWRSLKDAMEAIKDAWPGGQQEWGGFGVASYMAQDGTQIVIALAAGGGGDE